MFATKLLLIELKMVYHTVFASRDAQLLSGIQFFISLYEHQYLHSLNGQNLVLVSSLVFLTFLFCPLLNTCTTAYTYFPDFWGWFYTWNEGHFTGCRAVYYYFALSWLSGGYFMRLNYEFSILLCRICFKFLLNTSNRCSLFCWTLPIIGSYINLCWL